MFVYEVEGQIRRKEIPLIPQGEWRDAKWTVGVDGDARDAIRVVEKKVPDHDVWITSVYKILVVDTIATVNPADWVS